MSRMICQARCRLPVSAGEFALKVYGNEADGPEVVLIGIHRTTTDPNAVPLVRMHSACVTGDILGSLRCDCGAQLSASIDRIFKQDYGVLLYLLQHEGRGIGLANKMRAYALQEEGLNTAEANRALGLPEDSRTYQPAADVLLQNGIRRIRLATNNPEKLRALEESGIEIVERVHLGGFVNEYNAKYLQTKDAIMHHLGSFWSLPADTQAVQPTNSTE